jgi:hypothetical protein
MMIAIATVAHIGHTGIHSQARDALPSSDLEISQSSKKKRVSHHSFANSAGCSTDNEVE